MKEILLPATLILTPSNKNECESIEVGGRFIFFGGGVGGSLLQGGPRADRFSMELFHPFPMAENQFYPLNGPKISMDNTAGLFHPTYTGYTNKSTI